MELSELYFILKAIEGRKRRANRVPCYTLYTEDLMPLCKKSDTKAINKLLRTLWKEGKITAGKTINDTWIELT